MCGWCLGASGLASLVAPAKAGAPGEVPAGVAAAPYIGTAPFSVGSQPSLGRRASCRRRKGLRSPPGPSFSVRWTSDLKVHSAHAAHAAAGHAAAAGRLVFRSLGHRRFGGDEETGD